MPSLQLHQLRVAAVAQTLCDGFVGELDSRAVLLACLFHDMGNIIKSDLSKFPDFVEPEGVAHWQLEKDATITKYGEDSHEANVAIAREIGLPEKSIWLIDNISFSQLENIVADENFERKIVEYADSRVGPHGVVSLEGRFADALERYTSRYPNRADAEESYRRFAAWAKAIEQQVFGKVAMAPEDITEHSIQPLLEQLRGHLVH